ncbi:MAG: hypothetical protein R6U64_08600 [Bacteroidales bacterium]
MKEWIGKGKEEKTRSASGPAGASADPAGKQTLAVVVVKCGNTGFHGQPIAEQI